MVLHKVIDDEWTSTGVKSTFTIQIPENPGSAVSATSTAICGWGWRFSCSVGAASTSTSPRLPTFHLEKLKSLALESLRFQLSANNIVREAFSTFTSLFPEIQDIEAEFLVKHLPNVAGIDEILRSIVYRTEVPPAVPRPRRASLTGVQMARSRSPSPAEATLTKPLSSLQQACCFNFKFVVVGSGYWVELSFGIQHARQAKGKGREETSFKKENESNYLFVQQRMALGGVKPLPSRRTKHTGTLIPVKRRDMLPGKLNNRRDSQRIILKDPIGSFKQSRLRNQCCINYIKLLEIELKKRRECNGLAKGNKGNGFKKGGYAAVHRDFNAPGEKWNISMGGVEPPPSQHNFPGITTTAIHRDLDTPGAKWDISIDGFGVVGFSVPVLLKAVWKVGY
ncbi:hypothetical protein K438DRAFT_1926970 [Mycena galopus ATCC 62051]|nr:hypothetical protein K438DRAFT_1926970 [Mycena galopus ATCC 62051]